MLYLFTVNHFKPLFHINFIRSVENQITFYVHTCRPHQEFLCIRLFFSSLQLVERLSLWKYHFCTSLFLSVLLQLCTDHRQTHAALSCGKCPVVFAQEVQLVLLYDCRSSINLSKNLLCSHLHCLEIQVR